MQQVYCVFQRFHSMFIIGFLRNTCLGKGEKRSPHLQNGPEASSVFAFKRTHIIITRMHRKSKKQCEIRGKAESHTKSN